MFSLTPTLALVLLSTALATPAAARPPACPKGQVLVRGACQEVCPTQGTLADVDACECPRGFGKVLFGGGGGECKPLACPTGGPFAPGACECPAGHAMKKLAKGKAVCEASKPPAAKGTMPAAPGNGAHARAE